MATSKWWKSYFQFTRKDKIALVVLAGLMVLFLFMPYFIRSKPTGNLQKTANPHLAQALNRIVQKKAANNFQENTDPYVAQSHVDFNDRTYTAKPAAAEFPFNPNLISKEEWKKLGLRDKTIQTIQNFLSKGGRFRKAEDLKKIYGLREQDYTRLEPYIRIPENPNYSEKNLYLQEETKAPDPHRFLPKKISSIDINTAAFDDWDQLPGIGEVLANRIIKYREKLGGFYSMEQIKETYGLPDSTFQNMKAYLIESNFYKKWSINTATIDDLKLHPYLGNSLAKAIIAYREQHGMFSTLEDLKKINIITAEKYKQIIPYLTL